MVLAAQDLCHSICGGKLLQVLLQAYIMEQHLGPCTEVMLSIDSQKEVGTTVMMDFLIQE
jgi:hypothetical protein